MNGDLLDEALWILDNCTRGEQLLGAFSGGKDSIALKRVCDIAGLDIEWHYHNTTIDPPEVVQFIKKNYPDVIFDRPKYGYFFNRARKKKTLPSRTKRWCCREYKESRGPLNCVWITGVRREESAARAKRSSVELNKTSRRVHVMPLSNWDSEFLWDFIRSEKLAYPSLYDEGFTRLGCVGCPLASRRNKEIEAVRWPRIVRKWVDLAKYIYELRAWDNFPDFNTFVI